MLPRLVAIISLICLLQVYELASHKDCSQAQDADVARECFHQQKSLSFRGKKPQSQPQKPKCALIGQLCNCDCCDGLYCAKRGKAERVCVELKEGQGPMRECRPYEGGKPEPDSSADLPVVGSLSPSNPNIPDSSKPSDGNAPSAPVVGPISPSNPNVPDSSKPPEESAPSAPVVGPISPSNPNVPDSAKPSGSTGSGGSKPQKPNKHPKPQKPGSQQGKPSKPGRPNSSKPQKPSSSQGKPSKPGRPNSQGKPKPSKPNSQSSSGVPSGVPGTDSVPNGAGSNIPQGLGK